MKAARINTYGDASVVEITDVPIPTPGPDDVLIEVKAAGLNPFDTSVRSGRVKETFQLNLPVTLGGDVAGVVTAVGSAVTSFVIGDAVYGQASVVAGNSGAFAEYAVTHASELAKAPSRLSLIEAASLPLVGVSALQALTEHLALASGQKLFIHGGAGGIGTVAIQLAKHLGAYVATTATGEGITYVKELGADQVIDYKTEDFSQLLQHYDAVFDTVGGDDFAKALLILKKGGRAVSMIAPADKALAAERGVTALTQGTKVSTKALATLRNFIDQGVIKPHIDTAFPLTAIRQAFETRESGSIRGKIVVVMKASAP